MNGLITGVYWDLEGDSVDGRDDIDANGGNANLEDGSCLQWSVNPTRLESLAKPWVCPYGGVVFMKQAAPSAVEVEAVTFDVGNTLITTWPSVGHVYAEIAARHGCVGVTAETFDERFRAVWPGRLHLAETRAGWEQVVDEVFEGIVDVPPSRTFFPELYNRFAQAEAWRIYDDVLPTLDQLAASGFRLAVISNWDERLRELLRRLTLDVRFETIVVSSEFGQAKPHPAIFAEASERLGLPAGRILHIGDSAEADLRGARDAGFQAFQILRSATESGPDHLQSLLELPQKLLRRVL